MEGAVNTTTKAATFHHNSSLLHTNLANLPNPSPIPPASTTALYDMSDDCNSSDDGSAINKTQKKVKSKKDNRIRAVHRYLGKSICEPTRRFSGDSKQNLARIARDARFRYRSSAKKRLQHLEWAAKTLTPPAFTYYVHLFRVDDQMQKLLSQLERKEKPISDTPVKAKPSQGSIIKSIRTMSEGRKFRKLRDLASEISGESKKERDTFNRWALTLLDEAHRTKFESFIKKQPRKMIKQGLMSRPLRDVPFSGPDRKLVNRLLALLMRTSESVARRPWPQMVHPERKTKSKQVRRAHHQMESDERLLDELRGRIELGWPDYTKTPYAGGLSNAKLIDKIRALEEEVLGITMLPSKTCIKRIIDIVNETYPRKDRISAKRRHALPEKIKKEFKKKLHLMYLYDKWRATNPPDSERFSDVLTKDH